MPPAREDLLTNEAFSGFWEENPLAAEYAKYVAYAVPPAPITQTVDVQDLMTFEFIEPLMYQKKRSTKSFR